MGLLDVLNKLSTDGIRVEVAFDDRTILRFMLWGCAAAVLSSVVATLIRKKMAG